MAFIFYNMAKNIIVEFTSIEKFLYLCLNIKCKSENRRFYL